jgi:hypothetical protein
VGRSRARPPAAPSEDYRDGLRPFAIAAWNISKEFNVGSLVPHAHASRAEVLLVGDATGT